MNTDMRSHLLEISGAEELVFFDGLDDAVISVWQVHSKHIVVYDKEKILNIYMTRDNMSEEDALEYFYYNTVGAYVGELTPMVMETKEH